MVDVVGILAELNVVAVIVITRAVLPGVIPTAILSPLAVESVSVASEKAPVVFASIENRRTIALSSRIQTAFKTCKSLFS
ncbi:MAG TPA: hypothetical protein VEL11_06130 [Candidatus Bathyarchaeia archaeon]|nr:hypothetical protein [Candidatus Bathyarchaeia archaeon]